MKDNTKRKIITETIWRKENDLDAIRFGEINIELRPNDVIIGGYKGDDWNADTNSDYYYLEVQRERFETDDELAKRIEIFNKDEIRLKKGRYDLYLTLKKEFENGQ